MALAPRRTGRCCPQKKIPASCCSIPNFSASELDRFDSGFNQTIAPFEIREQSPGATITFTSGLVDLFAQKYME